MSAPPGGARPRAVVIGGSVAGLFAGNMLIRRGWEVDIFERVGDTLASRGAGIAWHDEVDAVMTAAGASSDAPFGIAIDGRRAYDRLGREIAYYPYRQYLAAWGRAYDPLYAAFPAESYHRGKDLVGIERGDRRTLARFSDGEVVAADLIVGADGFRSTVRALMAPEVVPRYGGYVAWRGLVEEAHLSPRFRAQSFEKFAFCFPPRSQFIGYPVPGHDHSIEPGRRRYNFLWYYPVESGEELADLLTDDTGATHDYSISPALIRREHVQALIRNATALLPPQFAEVVGMADRYMLQPIYDVVPDNISFERVALVGDAAFVARPHVGIGVLKAGQDALALTTHLTEAGSVEEALAGYQATRLSEGHAAVRFGRHLGAFIERRLAEPTTDRSLELSPETIIRVSGRPLAC